MPAKANLTEFPEAPAMVQSTHMVNAILAAYGRFEDCGRERLKAAQQIGQLLCEQKEKIPHGKWVAWVEANCSFDRKRAALFMQVHRERNKCRGAATFEDAVEMIRHLPDPSESAADAEKRRKILVDLIGIRDPDLKKQLLDGGIVLTDEQLEKSVPPHCDMCDKMGPPSDRHCASCAALNPREQGTLFADDQEPEYEDDPASLPKSPADPFDELKVLTTQLAAKFTRMINSHGERAERLIRYLSWCGVIDHPNKASPKFLPLVGVRRIVDLACRREPCSQAFVRREYEKACGIEPWIPPATHYRRGTSAKERDG